MMLRKLKPIVFVSFVIVALALPQGAYAIPSFAKKYGLACSSCHTAWPLLNAFGRRFKENGYRVNREQEASKEDHVKTDALSLYKFTYLTIRTKGFLYDKKRHSEGKVRAFHEAELMFAGNVFESVSTWIEIEAEDEDNFEPKFEIGVVGFHPFEEFNVLAGYGPVFWADPYDSLADGGRRMTRAHKAMMDLAYATDQKLRESTQFITAYGRLAKRVFYDLGISTGIDDPEGEDDIDFHGRLAIDVTNDIMIGGFLLAGQKSIDEVTEASLDFTRGGFDVQIQTSRFEILGALMFTKDDIDVTGLDENNHVFYVQAMYFYRKDKRPLVVPIVRIESYTLNDGNDTFTDGVFNLTFYPIENVNLSVEFWTNLDTPSGIPKSNRITFLFNTVF